MTKQAQSNQPVDARAFHVETAQRRPGLDLFLPDQPVRLQCQDSLPYSISFVLFDLQCGALLRESTLASSHGNWRLETSGRQFWPRHPKTDISLTFSFLSSIRPGYHYIGSSQITSLKNTRMSGYGYAPPPPPPAAQSGHQGYRNQGSPYQRQGGSARGGAPPSRGRGGYSGPGRQDYHHPPPQYDYSSQPSYPAPASYAAAQPPTVSYGAHQQWSQDQRQPPPQPQPHAPAPLSSANYHPNYAPQHYGPAHPQAAAPQPGYAAPPPQSQSYQYAVPAASYGSHPAWHGHEQQQHAPQYGAHPRGGYGSDRGGSRAPSLGSHTRPEYGSPGMQPQVTGGYAPPQPYADPRASVPAYPPQPQYHYAPPPPPSHASPQGRDNHFKHDGHRGHHGGRGGRGGGRGGGNNHRGKPHHHAGGGGDRNRNRPHGPRPDHGNDHKHENQNAPGKKKKRKTNTLGLTPGQPGQESESEDDEKEEETLRKLLGQDALQ